MKLQEEALKFIELKSVCEEGNEEIINYLIPKFEEMGAKLILQHVPHSLADHSKRQFNLIGILGDDLVDSRTKKGLLLTTHVDTAAPGLLTEWTKVDGKPWNARIEDGKIFGLGAAHSKLNFLCMMLAFSRFVKNELRQPIYLAATCGGESSLLGSKYLIQSGALNPKYVVVGHPTDLSLANSQRPQMTFQVKISYVAIERDAQEFNAKIFISSKSKSGYALGLEPRTNTALQNIFYILHQLMHSPIPVKLFSIGAEASLNKIPDTATAGVVIPAKELEGIRDRFKSLIAQRSDAHFDMRFGGTGDRGIRLLPDELLPSLFLIKKELEQMNQDFQGGVSVSFSSIKPDKDSLNLLVHCNFSNDFTAPEKRKEIETQIKERLMALARNYKSLSVDVRRVVSYVNFLADSQNNFARTMSAELTRAGIEAKFTNAESSSEAAFFSEKAHEVMAFGPALVKRDAYIPNENVSVDDLQAAIRFYERIIDAFCVRGI